ncbi:MAG: DinB family protein [Chloroflexi bacterium]|nr:DinB family protein [Chloroflexota bacterium]
MDFRDVAKSAFAEYRQDLQRALEGLTPAELHWQPSLNSNHALWLTWHTARVEDMWITRYLGGQDEVWISGRWSEELRLPAIGNGYGSSTEQIAAFPNLKIDRVLAYFDSVQESSLGVIESLTDDDLDSNYPGRHWRDPEGPKVSWVLSHMVVEAAEHIGQVAFIRGMLRGLNQ